MSREGVKCLNMMIFPSVITSKALYSISSILRKHVYLSTPNALLMIFKENLEIPLLLL